MTEFLASVIVRHRVSLREPDDRLQRTIQYAVTYRFISDRSGILDAPLSRGMTAECSGGVIPNTICKPPFHAHAVIGQQAFCLTSQSAVPRVADRDQHVADKTVAADALDR